MSDISTMQETDLVRSEKTAEDNLNLKLKLRQRSVIQTIDDIDWIKGSESPYVVELDPTTACNLACPDCISRDLLNQGYFSRKRLRELTKEMIDSGVKAVVLIGGGEPLAHPEIGWVIEYLAQNDVQVGITTNGLLIDRYLNCIAEHASWVRVSMDAASSETYNFFRPSPSGKSMFDKAVDNMSNLAKIKKGKLGYSFLILTEGEFDKNNPQSDNNNVVSVARSNVSEIYKGAVLAKEIGCDYFEIKPEYDIHHYSVVQKANLMSQAKDLIEKTKTLQDDNFFVLEATKLHHVLNGEPNEEPKDYKRCAVSQLRTLVTPSGVYVCPYFRGNEEKSIGDVNKVSFNEMWQGDARKNVMDKLDPSKDCRFHCIRHESNLILENHISGTQRLDPVEDFDYFV